MRRFNRFCAMLGLMLAISLPALAGQIPCDDDDVPPPPPTTTQSVAMDGVAMSLLQSVLALF